MNHSAFHKRAVTTHEQIIPSPAITPILETPNQERPSISPIEMPKENKNTSFIGNEGNSSIKLRNDLNHKSITCIQKTLIPEEGPFDDPFLMDSFNTQIEDDKKNNIMGVLKDSIAYYEHSNATRKSPVILNSSNQTTSANSLNKSVEFQYGKGERKPQESLKIKYNELKNTNKMLMNDYTKLRLQVEDIKQTKEMYENQLQYLQQKIEDTELKLEHVTELYTREKIEKENNASAFKSIIEQMANSRSCSPTFDKPMYVNQSFAPGGPCNHPTYCFGNFNEELSNRIKKIEEDLGDKGKEIKTLKMNVSRQRMSPPLYSSKNKSPNMSKGAFFSPPSSVHNVCKLNRDALESQNMRASTMANKPKYSNLAIKSIAKKDGGFKASPKCSPGYDRQPIPTSMAIKAKNTGQILPKH